MARRREGEGGGRRPQGRDEGGQIGLREALGQQQQDLGLRLVEGGRKQLLGVLLGQAGRQQGDAGEMKPAVGQGVEDDREAPRRARRPDPPAGDVLRGGGSRGRTCIT